MAIDKTLKIVNFYEY